MRKHFFKLWFGDERGYNATPSSAHPQAQSCGLVMKEDITQQRQLYANALMSCGFVMKEDITQPNLVEEPEVTVVVW